MIRDEFYAMLNDDGCPECGSVATYYTKNATLVTKDNVPVCICDDCGHVEEQFAKEANEMLPL